jgi:hypothetical protein
MSYVHEEEIQFIADKIKEGRESLKGLIKNGRSAEKVQTNIVMYKRVLSILKESIK